MSELTPLQEKVYRAVYFIEKRGGGAVSPCAKNIASFLAGNEDNPNAWFYRTEGKLFGSVPKMTAISVLSSASKLIELGYLKKESIDGSVCYSITLNDPFEAERFLISQTLPESKKKVLKRFTSLVDHYFKGLVFRVENSEYVGYRRLPERSGEGNWFWVTDFFGKKDALKVKIRQNPDHNTVLNTLVLLSSNVTDVLAAIKTVIDPENQIQIGNSKNAKKQLPDVAFASFVSEIENKSFFINELSDPVMALIAIADASPFFYRDSTQYLPSSFKTIVEDKKNFDFSIQKWKLVAWTSLKERPQRIQEALIVSKKTRSLWVVLSIPNRRVICLSKAPFHVALGDREYSSSQLFDLLFE